MSDLQITIEIKCKCGNNVPIAVLQRFLDGKTAVLECTKCNTKHTRETVLGQDGFVCGLCGHKTGYYRRTLNSGMCRALFELWSRTERDPGTQWWHHREFDFFGSRETHKLVYWDLVEEKPHDKKDKTKRSSGHWRITEKGKMFAANQTYLPGAAIVFHNHLIRMQGPPVKIVDAVVRKFHYGELMQAHREGILCATSGVRKPQPKVKKKKKKAEPLRPPPEKVD